MAQRLLTPSFWRPNHETTNTSAHYYLKIDGVDVAAREHETILELAQENNIFIPTLCHLDGLSEYGGCRICVVEVKGSNKLFPACMTPATEGMEVITNSERLRLYRFSILDMLFPNAITSVPSASPTATATCNSCRPNWA